MNSEPFYLTMLKNNKSGKSDIKTFTFNYFTVINFLSSYLVFESYNVKLL